MKYSVGLGGSCHWCTEAIFKSLKGVQEVEQGWIAATDDMAYFSEAVIVTFDQQIIPLHVLISIHLATHSCTSRHSMREKYRSAIYVFSEKQFEESKNIITLLQKEYAQQIITEILMFGHFKKNVDTYLNYYYNDPQKPFCKTVINPKLKKLINEFSVFVNQESLSHL